MTKDLRIKLLILVFVVSFFSVTRSQSEPSDAERLKALNTEVVEKFRAGKLDDAAKAAQLLADLTSRVLGKDDVETAVAFSNLGEIYSRKQNDGLAYSNYQTAWNIYKRNAFKNPGEAGKVLTRLAQLSLSVRKVDPLRNEIEALMSTAEAEDASAKLIYPYILSVLTMIYTDQNQFDKADSVFLKRYAAFTKLTRQNLEAFEGLEDDRFFFESTISNRKESEGRKEKFEASLRLQEGDDLVFGDVFYRARKSEVVLGKAVYLPKPDFPQAAKANGAKGSVVVRVLIAEDGSVINATAIAGHPLLRISAETSARGARFSETKLAGKPMKVRGKLTYYFVN